MKKVKQRIKTMLVILLISILLNIFIAMNIKIRNDEIKRQNEEIIELKGGIDMRCVDCARFPFCEKINNPSDLMCEEAIRKPDDEFTDWLINREN